MRSVSCIVDSDTPLVLDSSVFVNLSATGFADKILDAIPMEVVMPAQVISELKRSIKQGYNDAIALLPLLEDGIVASLDIPRRAHSDFISLVSGPSMSSLSDGEAATIAISQVLKAWAAIDDRKSRRVCAERFRHLKLASSVDIISHCDVVDAFSERELAAALLAALEVAHMEVEDRHVRWVGRCIGFEKLNASTTLPRKLRERLMSGFDGR